MVDFDIAPVKSSIIMCVGVGGGGGNAVRHMFKLGIADVTFVICNTDRQALEDSPIPNKIRLGDKLTSGLGAGNKPERGKQAALESLEDIKQIFADNDTKMLFVTAGMGGGTGTGAAPVIAKAAKDMGILTVAIVSIPFKTEGRKRIQQAIDGIEEISNYVDSLLVVDNESIKEIHGNLTLSEAFGKADDILATAAKSISDIITSHFKINVDFEDVKTVMQNSGVALMGSAQGSGPNRALEVATKAMSSPLLNHKDINGAQNVLLNITSGTNEVTLDETYEITEYIQERAGNNNGTDIIWGAGQDESLGDDIRVTVVATGFGMDSIPALKKRYEGTLDTEPERIKLKEQFRQTINLDTPEVPVTKVAVREDNDFAVVTRETAPIQPQTVVPPQSVNPIPVQIPDKEQIRQQIMEQEENSSYTPLTKEMTDAELNIPAYLRKGIQLESISNTSKAQRETLDTQKPSRKEESMDLFVK